MKNVIVYGAGEFGSLISNIISYHSNLNIVAYGDDNLDMKGKLIDEVPVLGNEDLLHFSKENEIEYAIVSIGNNKVRAEKYTLLITTTTVSAAKYAEKTYGKKILHQFAPLDVDLWVKRFLKKWDPSLVIWIESDLWPATLNAIKKLKIKAILLNLRLSPTSFEKWKLYPSFYNNLQSLYVLSYSVLPLSVKIYNVKIILNSSCLLTQLSYKFAKIAYN